MSRCKMTSYYPLFLPRGTVASLVYFLQLQYFIDIRNCFIFFHSSICLKLGNSVVITNTWETDTIIFFFSLFFLLEGEGFGGIPINEYDLQTRLSNSYKNEHWNIHNISYREGGSFTHCCASGSRLWVARFDPVLYHLFTREASRFLNCKYHYTKLMSEIK